jgi:hypothetical protein
MRVPAGMRGWKHARLCKNVNLPRCRIYNNTPITFEIYTCGELRSPVRVSWVLIKFINDRGRPAQTQFFFTYKGSCVPLPCRTLFHEELRPSNVVGYRGGTRKCVENGWKVVMDRVALSTSNPLNAIHTNYTRDDNNTFTIRRRKRQGPLVGGGQQRRGRSP